MYLRLSLDRHGDQLGIDRQREACHELMTSRGWSLGREYVDNDISATSGRRRPGFEALLEAREQLVVVWHVDRLVRVTRDLERVIDTGASVHAVRAGHLDLSTPSGRAVARTVTAWATYEGESKADRQRAANDQRAARGIPVAGIAPFGFEHTRDEHGKVSGMAVVPAEAEAIRAGVERLLSGGSLAGVCRAWDAAGHTTGRGRPWQPYAAREAVSSLVLAGVREHRGVEHAGNWPPILDRATVDAVRRVLADPGRRTTMTTVRSALLAGILRCGLCGEAMRSGRTQHGADAYRCSGPVAHLVRAREPIDEYVVAVVLARLADPRVTAALVGPDTDVAEARAQADQLRARLDDLAAAFADGEVTRSQLGTATARLRDRLDVAESTIGRAASTGTIAGFAAAPEAAWEAADLDARRAVIRALVVPVALSPGRGARRFDPDSVRLDWQV